MRTRLAFVFLMVMVSVTITSAQPPVPAMAQDGVTSVQAAPVFGPQPAPEVIRRDPSCWMNEAFPSGAGVTVELPRPLRQDTAVALLLQTEGSGATGVCDWYVIGSDTMIYEPAQWVGSKFSR